MREGILSSIRARVVLALLYVGVFLTAPLKAFPGALAAGPHPPTLRAPLESPLKVRLRVRSYTAPRKGKVPWGERAPREARTEAPPGLRPDFDPRPLPDPRILSTSSRPPGSPAPSASRPLRC